VEKRSTIMPRLHWKKRKYVVALKSQIRLVPGSALWSWRR